MLDQFIGYLLGKDSWTELSDDLGVPERTLQDRFAWCWGITPPTTSTGEIHDVLVIDATRVGDQSCFIASTPSYVVSWDFMPRENSAYWESHLSKIPPPTVVVCDGQKGVLLALSRVWPGTRIQRCLKHVQRNLFTKLTRRPESESGQDLLVHFALIWDVQTESGAARWIEVFHEIYNYHGEFFSERTYSLTITAGKHSWWYTHKNVRSAYRQIDKLIRDDQLFIYLDEQLKIQGVIVPRTSNRVEGGLNSGLQGQLYIHRGMTSQHQQKLVEWYLYVRTEGQKPPRFRV
jgi:hypothetical protein